MASKQYISLIRLLDHCDIASDENFNPSRLKKQLQAEFTIAKDGFIETGGFIYNRQDVFEEVEHPDLSRRLIFHHKIWKAPATLSFLEQNSAELSEVFKEKILTETSEDFRIFISPFVAGPFSYLARTMLANFDFDNVSRLLELQKLIKPEDRDDAFRPIRSFLEENKRLLRNVSADNYKMMRPQLLHFIEKDWGSFFNRLPEEFYEEKSRLTARLVDLTVAIQKPALKDCKKISSHLRTLDDIPENLRSLIQSNHNVYSNTKKFNIRWGGGGTWGIIWIFIMVIRAVSSGGCGNSNNYDDIKFSPVRYEVHDSVFKKLNDSSVRLPIFNKKYQ